MILKDKLQISEMLGRAEGLLQPTALDLSGPRFIQ